MDKITDSINNPDARQYFESVTRGSKPEVDITPQQYGDAVDDILAAVDCVIADAKNTAVRMRLGCIPEAISFSYIARTYFGKSRAWLMQKINGNVVNGRKTGFTDEEARQFRLALIDISNKLSAAARNF